MNLPLKSQKISRCSLGVSKSNNISCYGQTPRNYLISDISLNRSCPYISHEPSVESNSPVNIEIVVVFPAPLCPSKANI